MTVVCSASLASFCTAARPETTSNLDEDTPIGESHCLTTEKTLGPDLASQLGLLTIVPFPNAPSE